MSRFKSSRGRFSLEASLLEGVVSVSWDEVVSPFFIKAVVGKMFFKRTPARTIPAEMVTLIEADGMAIEYVDVAEEEVP